MPSLYFIENLSWKQIADKWMRSNWCIPGSDIQSSFENLIQEIQSVNGLGNVERNISLSNSKPAEWQRSYSPRNLGNELDLAVRASEIKPEDIRLLKELIWWLNDREEMEFFKMVTF